MTCNKNGAMIIVRNLLRAINNIMSSRIALEILGRAASYSVLGPEFISPKKKRQRSHRIQAYLRYIQKTIFFWGVGVLYSVKDLVPSSRAFLLGSWCAYSVKHLVPS
jgi:hypothetical protein